MLESVDLERLQNADGGWGFNGNSSRTEPTCFALLALAARGESASDACRRGARWLASRQRHDGGWAPQDNVDESTWVSALALLLPESLLARPQRDRAAAWLGSQMGRETSLVFRVRMRLLNIKLDNAEFEGWPWYPGAAAWVTPTALSILAMEKYAQIAGPGPWRARIEQGKRFLLARRCRDGGWNHGSSKALGYDSDSYPETTGVALLALHDSKDPAIKLSETLAESQLSTCRSPEAASWLRLGLTARGSYPRASRGCVQPARTTLDLALSSLAESAASGRNIFVS